MENAILLCQRRIIFDPPSAVDNTRHGTTGSERCQVCVFLFARSRE